MKMFHFNRICITWNSNTSNTSQKVMFSDTWKVLLFCFYFAKICSPLSVFFTVTLTTKLWHWWWRCNIMSFKTIFNNEEPAGQKRSAKQKVIKINHFYIFFTCSVVIKGIKSLWCSWIKNGRWPTIKGRREKNMLKWD